MNRFISFVVLLITTVVSAFGQVDQEVEMADQMRADGKIYVVVAVVLIVFIGLILYLISLDRKISKLEKERSV